MRSPLCAALEGMLRTPGRVPREAAPRNKCRVPWQRREFPGLGGRKRPQPSSRLRKQNPIPVPREQNGRKATPRERRGRFENPKNPFSFRGNALLVGGDYTELKEPEIGPALPPQGPSAPGAAGERSAADSILGRRRSSHCANPAGPTRPARSLLLKPRRRAWTLRASTGL